MYVTRAADDGGRAGPRPRPLNGPSILASAGQDAALVGNLVLASDLAQVLHQLVVGDHRGVLHQDPHPVGVPGHLLGLRDAGSIAGDRRVEPDADVRFHRVGRRGGPPQSDFLLHGEHHHDLAAGPRCSRPGPPQLPNRLHGHEARHPVVERLGDDLARLLHEGLVHHHVIPDLDLLPHLLRIHADVDEELARLRNLFAILGGREVNGFSAGVHDPVVVGAITTDEDPPREEVAGIESPRRVQPDESFLVDVPDVEPDLVHVGGDHHPRAAG